MSQRKVAALPKACVLHPPFPTALETEIQSRQDLSQLQHTVNTAHSLSFPEQISPFQAFS